MLFIQEGTIQVGYKDKESEGCIYPVDMKQGTVVGSLEVAFNLNLDYQYKSFEKVKCFSIRKRNWTNLLKNTENIFNYQDFTYKIQRRLLNDFMIKIYIPIKEFKED